MCLTADKPPALTLHKFKSPLAVLIILYTHVNIFSLVAVVKSKFFSFLHILRIYDIVKSPKFS